MLLPERLHGLSCEIKECPINDKRACLAVVMALARMDGVFVMKATVGTTAGT